MKLNGPCTHYMEFEVRWTCEHINVKFKKYSNVEYQYMHEHNVCEEQTCGTYTKHFRNARICGHAVQKKEIVMVNYMMGHNDTE